MQTSTIRFELQPPCPDAEECASHASVLELSRIDSLPALKKPKGYEELCPELQLHPYAAAPEPKGAWHTGLSRVETTDDAFRLGGEQLKTLRAWLANLGKKRRPAN